MTTSFNISVPVMIPNRYNKWVDGVKTNEKGYGVGPTITSIANGRVRGYYYNPNNANFDVAHTKYGFRVGGCGDQYYFSDIGKELSPV